MSNEVFDRRYSLIIGRLGKKILQTIPTSIASENTLRVPRYLAATNIIKDSTGDVSQGIPVDYRTIPDSFIEIRDLNIRAKVLYKKSGVKGGNQSSYIEIDNLSEDTLSRIKNDDLIFLKAGYKVDIQSSSVDYDDLPLVLSSTISDIETKRQRDGTRTTVLTCMDNILPKKNLKVSRSWPPNTKKRQVLNDLVEIAKSNFVPLGKIVEVDSFLSPLEEVYPTGYSISGNLFEEFEKLASSIDYRFYVSLSKIYFEPKSAIKTFEFVDVFPENLKEPISFQSDSSTKKSGSKNKKQGVRIRTFLNGRVRSSMAVNIQSYDPTYDGTYTIEAIQHDLDYEGNNWDTIIKANRV